MDDKSYFYDDRNTREPFPMKFDDTNLTFQEIIKAMKGVTQIYEIVNQSIIDSLIPINNLVKVFNSRKLTGKMKYLKRMENAKKRRARN